MKPNKLDYIDFEEVNSLLEGFNRTTGFVTAILDLEGNVLSKSGWRRICVDFHRVNAETASNCRHSDTVLSRRVREEEKYHFYKCLNGLVDVAVPVIINGEHIANLFSGQFFFEKPDREFFVDQAKKYGFDENEYLCALDMVPVVSEEKVKVAMDFLLGMTLLISEITLQRLEQEELNEQITQLNERISTATKASGLGIWDWDLKTNELLWDDQMYTLYGLKKEDYNGTTDAWMRGVDKEAREVCIRETSLAISGEKDFDTDFPAVWLDGSVHHIKAKGEVFHNEAGEPVRMVGVNYDITERKKIDDILEQRVKERTSQLQAAINELDSFSYSVSHDLRSPLRHINGFAEILSKDYSEQLPAEAKRYLSTIIDSALKMGTLIDDLLSFSRTGRMELSKSVLNMNHIIDEVLLQIKPSIDGRTIDWKIAELPKVQGDYNLIKLVWTNLIENAIKYTLKNEKAVIQIGHRNETGEAVFYIVDNGAGFDMKYSHKLFGVFQRLHTDTEFEGTGIGLANVRRIIERHGGRTWAEGKEGKGATFYFSLPGTL
jgi:signal transduction histidine kinase/ligand-binding sensor protein